MVAIIFMLSFVSCDEDGAGTAGIQVRLADSSPQYDGVLIDVQSVQVNFSDDEEGWILLPTNKGTYNLLELTDGIDTLLAEGKSPQGTLAQLKLILGDNNHVVVANDTLPLATPGAQHSGLKLKLNEMFLVDTSYTLRLDFNSGESIIKAGNSGKYNLKPVIRLISATSSGT